MSVPTLRQPTVADMWNAEGDAFNQGYARAVRDIILWLGLSGQSLIGDSMEERALRIASEEIAAALGRGDHLSEKPN